MRNAALFVVSEIKRTMDAVERGDVVAATKAGEERLAELRRAADVLKTKVTKYPKDAM